MKRILKVLQTLKSDELYFTQDLVDIFYLTGKKLSKGAMVFAMKRAFLFVDSRYEEAMRDVEGVCLYPLSEVNSFLKRETGSLLVDFSQISHRDFLNLQTVVPSLKDCNLIKSLRMVKEQEEIEYLRRSAMLNREAYEHILFCLKEGVTEKEVALEYELFAKRKGVEGLSFSPIVLFGKNTSLPHGKPSLMRLQQNMPVTIDVGLIVNNYASDMTRSFWFGEKKSQAYERVEKKVQEVKRRALSMCKPGENFSHINDEMKKWLSGEPVKHNIGHGIGLECHELPICKGEYPEEDKILKENVTITIEPGLYFEGEFGFREEDAIVITNGGYDNL